MKRRTFLGATAAVAAVAGCIDPGSYEFDVELVAEGELTLQRTDERAYGRGVYGRGHFVE